MGGGNPELYFRYVIICLRKYQTSILFKDASVLNSSLKIKISQIRLKTKYKHMLLL
jgi:hypothetical protein